MLATGTPRRRPLIVRPLIAVTLRLCLFITVCNITGKHVITALRRNKHTAGGADGWTPGELAHLPLRACTMLGSMLNTIEDGRPWPKALTHAKCAMVSQVEGTNLDPMAHRGLMVLSVIYRTWAKICLHQARHWQRKWQNEHTCDGFV